MISWKSVQKIFIFHWKIEDSWLMIFTSLLLTISLLIKNKMTYSSLVLRLCCLRKIKTIRILKSWGTNQALKRYATPLIDTSISLVLRSARLNQGRSKKSSKIFLDSWRGQKTVCVWQWISSGLLLRKKLSIYKKNDSILL